MALHLVDVFCLFKIQFFQFVKFLFPHCRTAAAGACAVGSGLCQFGRANILCQKLERFKFLFVILTPGWW